MKSWRCRLNLSWRHKERFILWRTGTKPERSLTRRLSEMFFWRSGRFVLRVALEDKPQVTWETVTYYLMTSSDTWASTFHENLYLTVSGCVCFLCQVEVRLQQHHGGPDQTCQSHVVLVQHQTAQREPEGLQDHLQDQATEPEQDEPGHRATHSGAALCKTNTWFKLLKHLTT